MNLYVDAAGNVTDEFAALLVRLASAYPTTGKLSEASIRTYARALGDVPWAALTAACARAVKESRFYPSVAELRAYVEGTAEDAALIAWASLATAAEDLGAYVDVELADPATARALVAVFGSWPNYCAAADRDVAARRAEFLAAYRAAHRQADQRPVRLPGLCVPPEQSRLVGRVERDGRVLPSALEVPLPALPAASEAPDV